MNELDKLKSENAALRSQLNYINKRKRKTLIISSVIIIIGIVFSAFFAVFFTGNEKGYNKNIPDAGEAGTKIVFNNVTFYSANPAAKTILNLDTYDISKGDKKYAKFFSKDGKGKKVLVKCQPYTKCVTLKVGNETYLYVDEKINKLDFSEKSISEVIINSGSKKTPKNDIYQTYIHREYLSGDIYRPFVKLFCEYYKNKGEPVDKNKTKLFLGKDGVTLNISWKYENKFAAPLTTSVGEFFRDDEKNVYFYDYTDGKAYAVGKELSEYVYE